MLCKAGTYPDWIQKVEGCKLDGCVRKPDKDSGKKIRVTFISPIFASPKGGILCSSSTQKTAKTSTRRWKSTKRSSRSPKLFYNFVHVKALQSLPSSAAAKCWKQSTNNRSPAVKSTYNLWFSMHYQYKPPSGGFLNFCLPCGPWRPSMRRCLFKLFWITSSSKSVFRRTPFRRTQQTSNKVSISFN